VRRRVILLVFATTLFAVTMLGVILVGTIWAVMNTATQERAAAAAKVAASGLEDAWEKTKGRVDEHSLRAYVRDNAVLTAVLPNGRTLSSGAKPEGDAFVATASEGVGTDSEMTVSAAIPRSGTTAEVVREAVLVAVIALAALGLSMAMAWVYTRRLTKPLEDFAEVAGQIATGDARRTGQRYGIAEIDAVADVLDNGVTGFNTLLESERRVTSEVAHQLRTPLTALSLRIEEILSADSLPVAQSEATAALEQVERLSGVIDDVVAASRGHVGPVEQFSVDLLVSTQLSEWVPAFAAAGRALQPAGRTGMCVEGVRGMQAQVLATLIENSLVHGAGRTTVRTRESGSWVVLEVTDEGPGVPQGLDGLVFERNVSGGHSTGLGLALARTLITADGGRLEMLSARPAVFAMFLPVTKSIGVAPEPGAPTTIAPLQREGSVLVDASAVAPSDDRVARTLDEVDPARPAVPAIAD
jgi:signal transduction histidine kinase